MQENEPSKDINTTDSKPLESISLRIETKQPRSNNNEWTESETSTFFAACRGRKKLKVRNIMEEFELLPAMINVKDKNGRSGVSWACSSNNLEALQQLLQIGNVDVNEPDSEGNTPLMMASQAGHDEIVRFLLFYLPHQIKIDAENQSGFTALLKAALSGKTNCARLLIIAGADITKKDKGRELRADEWAKRCGMFETATVIQNMSKCCLTDEQNKELKWRKTRNPVIEFCSSTARYIERKMKWNGDQWQTTAGSLYHLASHSSALTCRTLTNELPERIRTQEKQDNVMQCIEIQAPGEDTLKIETCSYEDGKIERTITQRCSEKPSGVQAKSSTKITQIPEVKYSYSSPVKKQKKPKIEVDKNLLAIPTRKKKKTAD